MTGASFIKVAFTGVEAFIDVTLPALYSSNNLQVGAPVRVTLTSRASNVVRVEPAVLFTGIVVLSQALSGASVPIIVLRSAVGAWNIPNNTLNNAGAANYWRTFYVPSDVTQVAVTVGNRIGNAGAGSSVPCTFAIGTSNGSGGFQSSPTTYASQTVPGDGTVLTLPTTTVTRGSDGRICVAFSYPGGGGTLSTAYAGSTRIGSYKVGGSLYPTPAFDGVDITPLFQWHIDYTTAKRRFLVLGDSISVGASGTSPDLLGFDSAAWPTLGVAHDFAVDVEGRPGGTLAERANTVGYPYLWDQVLVSGCDVVVQLGVNDTPAGLSSMQASITSIVAYVRAAGAARVYASTVSPNTAYAAEAARTGYNTWLLANSLALTAVCDLDLALRDPANQAQLLAAYSSDGLHYSVAGQAAAKVAWETTLGI